MSDRHTCIKDDGGTPNRKCVACQTEKICTCNMTFNPVWQIWHHHTSCPKSLLPNPFVQPKKETGDNPLMPGTVRVSETTPAPKADPMIGIGGGPTRATTLPDDPAERKRFPIATGFFDYFPDAIVALSNLSWAGNEQHNPGKPLHWDRSKSGDEADTAMRHFAQRGTLDKDGKRHTAKAAWRLLALLQKELEDEQKEQKGTAA